MYDGFVRPRLKRLYAEILVSGSRDVCIGINVLLAVGVVQAVTAMRISSIVTAVMGAAATRRPLTETR